MTTTTTAPGPVNWLTSARLALLAALQADATLSAAVRMWYEWGPGLRHRYEILPSNCPLLSLVPAEMAEDQIANVVGAFDQDVEVGIATDGQDAAPCEELVAAALDVIIAESHAALGLASEGVSQLTIQSLKWLAVENEKDSRVRWEAQIIVRVHWLRRTV